MGEFTTTAPTDGLVAKMHTVDLLEEALQLAERRGFSVRRQWLAEGLGGACRIGQQRVLFINLSATNEEQLRHAVDALREIDVTDEKGISESLLRLIA